MPFTHGCCSKKLIFAGEALKEFEAMERRWNAQFSALPEALQGVLTRLIRADWRMEWTEQRVFDMEIALDPTPAAEWSDENHKHLQLFYRYQTTAGRTVHREWNLLKQYAKDQDAALVRGQVRETQKEKKAVAEPKQVEKFPQAYAVVPLTQTVKVEIQDGRTVTRPYPTNRQLMQAAAQADRRTRVIRDVEFAHGVPADYDWAAPEEVGRGSLVRRRFEISLEEWLELAEREELRGTGHLEPCEHAPTE
jgi:hypothetical protein